MITIVCYDMRYMTSCWHWLLSLSVYIFEKKYFVTIRSNADISPVGELYVAIKRLISALWRCPNATAAQQCSNVLLK